ncbi:MAG: DUF3857 and transglutaminase domain-containing protein [Chitinophagaceae bacterium]|nr:DUF3857 and transglutaminase domain-containing protein [Chitinophagaceae bacterium]
MKSWIITACLLGMAFWAQAAAYSTNSAYIVYYAQKTELSVKDTLPFTRTTYEIIFKFNDEKAVTLHHDYSIYLSYFEKLEDLEVVTKNPQPDGKIKTIKQKDFKANNAKSESVFYDDMQEYSIDFLGLTVGSEAHITYSVTTQESHFTDPFTFRFHLPVEKVYYELTVPENIKVSFLEKNNPLSLAKFNKEEKKNETVYSWTAEKVEEEKSYDSSPGRLFYTPHIIYKVDAYSRKGIERKISESTADLYRWYAGNMRGVNLHPGERIRQLSDSICNGAKDHLEKAKRIYQWVQANIRYVAFEAGMEGLVPRDAEAVCTKRYGDCKDMSNLQYSLLKAAGVEAYHTWIGTRRIPYTYAEVPLKNTDNHMIAAMRNGKDWIFLDATDPNCTFGLPADHIQGKQALIGISPTEFELAMVPVIQAKDNFLDERSVIRIEGNDIQVATTSTYGGLIAGNLANTLHYMTEKEKEDYAKGVAKRVSNNAVLKDWHIPDMTRAKEAEFKLSYQIPSYLREVGNEKYINLFLDKMFLNDAIKEDDRKVPYGFKFNLLSKTQIKLEIPAGYKISYVPENASFKEGHFGFNFDYVREGNNLICKQNIYSDFPDLIMKSDEFPRWNQFIKALNKAYKESVILEKLP